VNCETVHRQLLALECPDAPPNDVSDHLAGCSACRAVQEQLLAVEREVPFLPIAPPERRTAFLRQLREAPPPAPARPRLFRPSQPGRRERALWKMSVAVALAASLLVVALAAWLWERDSPNSPPPSNGSTSARLGLPERLKGEVRWREARTARERVVVLDDLARRVGGNALALARDESREKLDEEVQLYKELIELMTATVAPRLQEEIPDPGERKKVLDAIALRVQKVGSESERLAVERPRMADTLRELARIAVDGEREIRALV
jgi:hypothetical protein